MRKYLILISALLFISSISRGQLTQEAAEKKAFQDSIAAASQAMDASQTQLQMNQTAGTGYQAADKELNSIYQKILHEYSPDTSFISHLKAAQRLWTKWRDAELLMKFPPGGSYGSVKPMCEAGYLEKLTRDRIKTLKEWTIGIDEGDACRGSAKNKQ